MHSGQTFHKLKKEQREALITWIEEGLTLKVINLRGESFTPPFRVTRQQVSYYLGTRGVNYENLKADIIKRATELK